METFVNIDPQRKTPKYLQIVHCINQAIMNGKLRKGDQVCSINELSDAYLLGRDTVQKAYNVLRREGVLVGVPGKGFYVNRTDIHAPFRILLLFDKISHYKTEIYNGFVKTLGNKALYDLKIHHSDIRLFERQLLEKYGEYDYYVVIPHFCERPERVAQALQKIPVEKLVLLDKDVPEFRLPCAAVYQDYRKDIGDALEQCGDLLAKYEELILVQPAAVLSPSDIGIGFRNFCLNHRYAFRNLDGIPPSWQLKRRQAYVVVEEADLVRLSKLSDGQQMEIGRDIGIISYNETPLKELLFGGITVVSVDHGCMGRIAAGLILENKKERLRAPFRLVRRNTL